MSFHSELEVLSRKNTTDSINVLVCSFKLLYRCMLAHWYIETNCLTVEESIITEAPNSNRTSACARLSIHQGILIDTL